LRRHYYEICITVSRFNGAGVAPERPGLHAAGMAYGEALRAAGVIVFAAGLQPPDKATMVSVRDGKRHVMLRKKRFDEILEGEKAALQNGCVDTSSICNRQSGNANGIL
jgi:hypothetical protein